jgi:exodeoxyribonuclease VII large subunit
MVFKISGWRALEEGMRVQVHGSPRLYQKTARFSLWADAIIPSGEGALNVAFVKLKAQLEKEGLFDIARKRTIPTFPERIGLITAKGSQAYNDFTKILRERMGGLKIFFYPIRVQGIESARSISNAFEYFNEHDHDLDVVVLTRGGGSLEDLQSFNDENVARAIFSSRIPVVSGVGHEGDITLADLVADLRASTPTNAAELITREKQFVQSDVNYMLQALVNTMDSEVQTRKSKMLHMLHILSGIMHRHNKLFTNAMHDFYHGIRHVAHQVDLRKRTIYEKSLALVAAIVSEQNKTSEKLSSHYRLLNSLDYKNVLKRGFSITKTKSGSILKSIDSVDSGDMISTQLAHGTIESTVTKSY